MTKKAKKTIVDEAKKLGDDVIEFGKNTYLFGLGTVVSMEDQVRDVVHRMVDKGGQIDKSESFVGMATDNVKKFGQTVEKGFEDTMATTLNRAGVPSRMEVRTLIARVEELTEKVDALSAR